MSGEHVTSQYSEWDHLHLMHVPSEYIPDKHSCLPKELAFLSMHTSAETPPRWTKRTTYKLHFAIQRTYFIFCKITSQKRLLNPDHEQLSSKRENLKR